MYTATAFGGNSLAVHLGGTSDSPVLAVCQATNDPQLWRVWDQRGGPWFYINGKQAAIDETYRRATLIRMTK